MENYLIQNTLNYPILTLLLLVPAAGALGCLFIKDGTRLKAWSLAVSIVTMALSVPLFTSFDATTAKYQFAEVRRWFPALNLDYVVGVDGISVLMVLLTTFIMPFCVLCSWRHVE